MIALTNSTMHAIYLPMLWQKHSPNTDHEMLRDTASSFLTASESSISLFDRGTASLQKIEEICNKEMYEPQRSS